MSMAECKGEGAVEMTSSCELCCEPGSEFRVSLESTQAVLKHVSLHANAAAQPFHRVFSTCFPDIRFWSIKKENQGVERRSVAEGVIGVPHITDPAHKMSYSGNRDEIPSYLTPLIPTSSLAIECSPAIQLSHSHSPSTSRSVLSTGYPIASTSNGYTSADDVPEQKYQIPEHNPKYSYMFTDAPSNRQMKRMKSGSHSKCNNQTESSPVFPVKKKARGKSYVAPSEPLGTPDSTDLDLTLSRLFSATNHNSEYQVFEFPAPSPPTPASDKKKKPNGRKSWVSTNDVTKFTEEGSPNKLTAMVRELSIKIFEKKSEGTCQQEGCKFSFRNKTLARGASDLHRWRRSIVNHLLAHYPGNLYYCLLCDRAIKDLDTHHWSFVHKGQPYTGNVRDCRWTKENELIQLFTQCFPPNEDVGTEGSELGLI